MTFRIREFIEADRTALIALWQRCELTRPWNDPSADIDLAVRTETSSIILGLENGAVIASIMVGFDGHRGWVYYLAVQQGERRKGLGRRMMCVAEAWLMHRGAPKIQLMVRNSNQAAIGFYKALGYSVQDVITIGRRLDGTE